MPLQNVRLRVELGHMCTHAEVFPRLSGGGPKRRRRGTPPPNNGKVADNSGGKSPITAPTRADKPADTPTTWTIMQANAHGYIQRQGAGAGSGVE